MRTAPGSLMLERKLHRTQNLGLAQPLRLPGLLGSTLGMAANSCALPPTTLRTLRPRKRRGIVRVRRARRHPDGFVEIQHLVSSEGGDISLQNGPQVRVATLQQSIPASLGIMIPGLPWTTKKHSTRKATGKHPASTAEGVGTCAGKAMLS